MKEWSPRPYHLNSMLKETSETLKVLLGHAFFASAEASPSLRHRSLSLGNLSCSVTVSISIPRNVKQFTGPSNLEGSKGTPRLVKVDIKVCMFLLASSNDLVTKIKSSKNKANY